MVSAHIGQSALRHLRESVVYVDKISRSRPDVESAGESEPKLGGEEEKEDEGDKAEEYSRHKGHCRKASRDAGISGGLPL